MSWLTKLLQRSLSVTGREYAICSELPARDLIGEMIRRGFQLANGVCHFQWMIFRGRHVRILGRDRFVFDPGVSIGSNSRIDSRGSVGVIMRHGSRLGRNGIVTTTSHLSRYGVGLELGPRSGVGDNFPHRCVRGSQNWGGRDYRPVRYYSFSRTQLRRQNGPHSLSRYDRGTCRNWGRLLDRRSRDASIGCNSRVAHHRCGRRRGPWGTPGKRNFGGHPSQANQGNLDRSIERSIARGLCESIRNLAG